MLYFPQLSSGAQAQFPLRVMEHTRTIVNEAGGGELSRMSDPGAQQVHWTLRLTGLTDTERSAIETLHQACCGCLRSFVFLDPAANLITASEDVEHGAWVRDGLMSVAELATDDGKAREWHLLNTGQARQGIRQILDLPEQLVYTFSFRSRAGRVMAEADNGSTRFEREFTCGNDWAWCELPIGMGSGGSGLRVGLSLDPGAGVSVAGLQLEAQPHGSAYRPTSGHGGIYPQTRFKDGRLTFTALGLNNHSVEMELVSRAQR